MAPPFEVYEFHTKTFLDLLVKKSESPHDIVHNKLLSNYLSEYLADLDAKTILVENTYVDRDYLEDFAGYYVRCFSAYDRLCCRLHFFKIKFTAEEFSSLIKHGNFPLAPGIMQYAYLGFIVVKPLPMTIVGRTCLKTYPALGKRYYPIIREYTANLFGIPLSVDSLAFQEQDNVVAACATSALWSAFQKTGKLFNHPIPTPVEITKSATVHMPTERRTFPNKGLTTYQMAQAVQSISLEPNFVSVNPIFNKDIYFLIKSHVYAYIRGHIPHLLLFKLFDSSNPSSMEASKHAVAITGINIETDSAPVAQSGFFLRAFRINKLYVHDDQVGPFARMEFDNIPAMIPAQDPKDPPIPIDSLSTHWKNERSKGTRRGIPDILLFPLYHKIRIPFNIILAKIFQFDSFLKTVANFFNTMVFKDAGLDVYQKLEWDIYLITNNEYKNEIIGSSLNSGLLRDKVLLKNMPRFLWRATAYVEDVIVLEIIFDATDIEQGGLINLVIEHDDDLSFIVRFGVKIDAITAQYQGKLGWKIIEWYKSPPS